LYQGKRAHHDSNCCGKIFFMWVNPIVKMANKDKKLAPIQYGELGDWEKLEASLP